MSLAIKVNGVFLDFVKPDLKIKFTNDALTNKFTVPHSTYPIRIIENAKTVSALGDRSINNKSRKIGYACEVYFGSSILKGKLEVQGFPFGFRKCDLLIGSRLLDISDKKIHTFFEDVNVLGDNPEENPYQDDSQDEHNAWIAYADLAQANEPLTFPNAFFQFPSINFQDRFDAGEKENEALKYTGGINSRNLQNNRLIANSYTITSEKVDVNNFTVYAPHVFMLAVIKQAFESIGYGVKGDFIDHRAMQMILLETENDQLSKVEIIPDILNSYVWSTAPWEIDYANIPGLGSRYTFQKIGWFEYPSEEGSYRFDFEFEIEQNGSLFGFYIIELGGVRVSGFHDRVAGTYKGSISFEVTQNKIGEEFVLVFHSIDRIDPLNYTVTVVLDVPSGTLYDAHPTIEWSRYLPDWSIVEYMNNIKELFNLDIAINDIEQVAYFNFNEKEVTDRRAFKMKNTFRLGEADNVAQEHFLLKFANDQDGGLLVSPEAVELTLETPEYTSKIENKFKRLPYFNGSAAYSEYIQDREGVGLMFYDPVRAPYISDTAQNLELRMDGDRGIYENFWKVFLRFRLNALPVELKGPLTDTEILLIQNLKKINMAGQNYILEELEASEGSNGFLDVTLRLQTLNL